MKSILASSVALSLMFAACGNPVNTSANTNEWGQSVAQGQREAAEIRNMSDADEYNEGAKLDAALKDPSRKKETGLTIKIVNDPFVSNYISNIGQRLAATSSRNNIRYTFQVVDSDEVNAFATMGGFVYVNKGLLKIAQNEAQVAGVIAHEVGHIARRHVVQAIAQQVEIGGWQKGIGSGIGGAIMGVFSKVAFQLPKSRTAEFEADAAGYLNVRSANYVPDEMTRFYQEVLLKMGSSGNTMLSTHPDTQQRINGLQRLRVPSDSQGFGADSRFHHSVVSRL